MWHQCRRRRWLLTSSAGAVPGALGTPVFQAPVRDIPRSPLPFLDSCDILPLVIKVSDLAI